MMKARAEEMMKAPHDKGGWTQQRRNGAPKRSRWKTINTKVEGQGHLKDQNRKRRLSNGWNRPNVDEDQVPKAKRKQKKTIQIQIQRRSQTALEIKTKVHVETES